MTDLPPISAATLAEATGDYAAAGLPEPMTAERFCHLRTLSGLSFRDLAVALGMRGKHAATHLREMADGVRSIPGPTGVALEAVALGLVDDADLEAVILADLGGDFGDEEKARAAVRALRDLLGRRPI